MCIENACNEVPLAPQDLTFKVSLNKRRHAQMSTQPITRHLLPSSLRRPQRPSFTLLYRLSMKPHFSGETRPVKALGTAYSLSLDSTHWLVALSMGSTYCSKSLYSLGLARRAAT